MIKQCKNKNFISIKPVLQYRWKLEETNNSLRLFYYGLRNYPKHLDRIYPINESIKNIINTFDGKKPLSIILEQWEIKGIKKEDYEIKLNQLVEEGVIVDKDKLREAKTMDNHQTCIRCVNNNYVLPGLEFDKEGLCAFCQCFDNVKDIKSSYMVGGDTITEEDLIKTAKNNKFRFDVLVLYTGGKDSSYLLWYLAKKVKLRVLACTWNLPFSSETANNNMKAAKQRLPEVEFIERTVCWDEMQKVMQNLVKEFGIPCICPFISYALFYPIAVMERIPIIMDGIEASQTNLAKATMPLTAMKRDVEMSDRELAVAYFKNLAMPDIQSSTYIDQFVSCMRDGFPKVFDPIKNIIENSKQCIIPVIKRLQTDKLYKRWEDVAKILKEELDWEMPLNQTGLLHTSCDIECVKDFVQYMGFRNMKRPFFPMSMIEISSAVSFGHITREEGLLELKERGYYGIPNSLKIMMEKLNLSKDCLSEMHPDIREMFEGNI